MKKLFFLAQGFLFIAFNCSLLLTAYQFVGPDSTTVRPGFKKPAYNHLEEYEPALQRLNSISALANYCDSIYSEKNSRREAIRFDEAFPEIAVNSVRKRFYHGYSFYGFNDNFMAMTLSSLVNIKGLSAIVIPDDILKFPYAACSQQSIVLIELLREKGFKTRKVGFQGKTYGHFCFEVFYNGSWHFYDPDMEPNVNVLAAYHRPGIQFLASHQDILLEAYAQYPREKVLDIFPNYFYGSVDKFPAPLAMFYQKLTKFLSYTIWIFFLVAFIWVRRKYQRLSQSVAKQKMIYAPPVQEGIPAAYYPNLSA